MLSLNILCQCGVISTSLPYPLGGVTIIVCNCKPLIEGDFYEIHITNHVITASVFALRYNIHHHIFVLHHGSGLRRDKRYC